jgi:hypothetical protein
MVVFEDDAETKEKLQTVTVINKIQINHFFIK